MDNKEFNKLLVKYNLLSLKAARLVDFISNEYELNNKNEILTVISVIFSFEYLGHCYAPLNDLKSKYLEILNSQETLEKEEYDDESISEEFKDLKDTLDLMDIDGFTGCTNIIGDDKFFIVKDDMIFINKYYWASRGIKESFNDLFKESRESSNAVFDKSFIKLKLNKEQEEAIEKGLNYNLLITGGPGTGKTSTIVFLLLNLLKDKTDSELDKVEIHLAAPSGKAAVRMINSITRSLIDNITNEFKNNHQYLINKINSLKGVTIDKLLGYTTSGYIYNKDKLINPDKENIFIIDEASMIDILKFNSLLNAIKVGSRVFILGDKDQLPSVENGAVFNDLLKSNYKVELIESHRFNKDSEVYKLSRYINDGTDKYSFEFKDIKEFEVESLSNCEVRYYDDTNSQKEDIHNVIKKWYEAYIKGIKDLGEEISISKDSNDKELKEKLDNLDSYLTNAKILSANNNGVRGVNTINKYIKEELFDGKNKDYFHAQILMITQNIDELDLKNGDNGICCNVNGKYYFMIKKSYDNISEGYQEVGIFKINEYVFYPIELIKKEYITMSYAITIHKSQGSEYDNVLIILPENENNPLLTRQIVYTAITRTKKSCYIISNEKILEKAKNHPEVRYTKIL